jgi:hypothetical protein
MKFRLHALRGRALYSNRDNDWQFARHLVELVDCYLAPAQETPKPTLRVVVPIREEVTP